MNELRIIFMGSPEFAVPSLDVLAEHKFNVVAVVTAPDKPRGRGQKITCSPVKECALRHNIPVLQPPNLKSPAFIEELKNYNANLHVVVAFRMLPEVVWAMPKFGTFNLHASLLPQYRGAAPINWAIINGEKETGVTTFFLKHEIDTGSILFQEKEPIYDTDDAGSLYERLKTKGAALVLKTVLAIQSGNYPVTPQDETIPVKHAPKIFRETCRINWNQPTGNVLNFIRGLSPYPGAWTIFNNNVYKINKAVPAASGALLQPGMWLTDNKTYLSCATATGYLNITELQPEGKKRMTIHEFFRGNKL